jgi:hypothetical protein
LAVGFDEVVTDGQDVVHNHQLGLLAVDATRQIEKYFVVVVQVLCLLQLDACVQSLLVYTAPIALQERLLHF